MAEGDCGIGPNVSFKQYGRDLIYMATCAFYATMRSKDPSTKVGAMIVSEDQQREYMGYNGFPRGVEDLPERYLDRETKYKMIVHAEPNAIIKAGRDAIGGTIYTWPLPPCHECAKLIIQAGIKRVVAIQKDDTRWLDSCQTAIDMFREAGLIYHTLPIDTVHGLIADKLEWIEDKYS